MRRLLLATVAVLVMAMTISAGEALANNGNEGGFCRTIDPSARVCHPSS